MELSTEHIEYGGVGVGVGLSKELAGSRGQPGHLGDNKQVCKEYSASQETALGFLPPVQGGGVRSADHSSFGMTHG